MGKYVVRRLLQAIPLLFILSLVFFALVFNTPGGPGAGIGRRGRGAVERQERLERQYGLDQPWYSQYVFWMVGNDWLKVDEDGDGTPETYGTRKGILRGDFGVSYRSRKPVLEEIGDRLPNTIYLVSVTLLVVAIVAIPIGIISAIKQYSAFDITATTLSFMGQAVPEFWLGLILILIFYSWLQNPFTGEPLFPAGGMATIGMDFDLVDRLKHLFLPVVMGMVGWVAWYSRFLRSSMLEVIHKDYIRTARAKGQIERKVLYKHALKNALIPLVTIFALDFPYMFAGSLYVELIFSWPGMGRLFYDSATYRDYPVMLAIVIISSGIIIISNLLADIAYAWLDPRVRYD
jgi:peptide/nickel transport system permease protein